MPNYSILEIREIPLNNSKISKDSFEFYDIFISAFNSSQRVNDVFNAVNATHKYWIIHPEYSYGHEELPHEGECIKPTANQESLQVDEIFQMIGDINNKKICLDITGFMRHVLIFLIISLFKRGIRSVDILYSEPIHYEKDENTEFATKMEDLVSPVQGTAIDSEITSKDHLIINIGYDHKAISQVTTFKEDASLHPIFSFPSLSPDMYQQSAIRASKIGAVTENNDWIVQRKFAPANNPFATAQILTEILKDIDKEENVYLSPLSTKAQVLGFAIFWIVEEANRDISILLPVCKEYAKETSKGIKRIWLYKLEFNYIKRS